ncbi:DNA replication/repair protein RecF [Parafilimonas terrae]|uniref:DNA replication and repair protein RecF n=1 Tax=Parafilimonas terrae TaxID=1465490 RepID=A0A1I5S3T4_9BACT|nr:DNA replication and repair protein RecF [Parafilimonas terrae]SFP65438.1 DNA replication and repair protein RecF [Parafilimonas terrae]
MFACRHIALTQFRNYRFESFNFNENIIGIYGQNGSGKTNLLDAIYYLCFTKSSFNRPDAQSVKDGFAGFRIDGRFEKNKEEHKLVCILRENNRKEFLADEESYTRFSEHIGKYPCVMIAPDDVSLITEGSEERRKFIDTLLSQLQHDYLEQLIAYNKILQQRNSFLKFAAERNNYDEQLLEILNSQLLEKGNFIYERRQQFLNEFLPQVLAQYISIADKDDKLSLEYESQLNNNTFEELLQQNLQRDLYLQRTGTGIHKDDMVIELKQTTFKNIASQGQRKSLLFAFKLAAFETLKTIKGFAPILLLDDVFEKLDEKRMENLLQYVCVQSGAQVFITDTHKDRLQQSFIKIGKGYNLIGL